MGVRGYSQQSELMISGNDGDGTNSRVTVNGEFGMGWTTGTGNNKATIEQGGELHVGTHAIVGRASSSNNTLDILTGGNMTVMQDFVVSGQNANDNANRTSPDAILTVNGTNSNLSVGGIFSLGAANDGHRNELNVEAGGQVTVGDTAYIGTRGDDNKLWVTGANSSMTVTNLMYVGFESVSDGNEVRVENSGQLTVSGVNTSSGLFIGQNGSNNTFYVHSKGNVDIDWQLRLGVDTGSTNNLLEVSGNESDLTVAGFIHLGTQGSNNTIQVLAGGMATTGGDIAVGRLGSATNNLLRVSGEDSILTVNGLNLYVSQAGGAGNRLLVEDQGTVIANSIWINANGAFEIDGGTVGAANALTVADTAQLTFNGTDSLIHIGAGHNAVTNDYSANLLRVADGGTFTANGNADLGTDGTLLVQAGGTVAGAGTISGHTDVYGVLSPGNSAGTLTFDTLTLRADSEIHIQLGGTGAGEFDQVVANYMTIEGGTLYFTLINEYEPVYGDEFQIAVFADGVVTSPFAYNYDGLPTGWSVDDSELYSTGTVTIIPEPHSLGLILLGLGAVALRRRLRSGEQ